MKIRALATIPTAFLAGAGGRFGERAFERWAFEHSARFTSSVNLVVYIGLLVVPFLFFVIGIDPQ